MADLKTITVQGVGNFQVPSDFTDAQVKQHIQGLKLKRPDIFGAPAGIPQPTPAELDPNAPPPKDTVSPSFSMIGSPLRYQAPTREVAEAQNPAVTGSVKGAASTAYNLARLATKVTPG